jgi:hypothetical protein
MRRGRCSALLALAALCGAARDARPQTAQGAAFLLLPVGARATALGHASAADGGTTEALFWNPAGLAAVRRGEAAYHHYTGTAFYEHGDALAFAVPAGDVGTFGLAAYVLDYGSTDVTPPGGGPGPGPPIGRVSSRNLTLQVAFATEVSGAAAAGITYKLVQFRVDCSGDCAAVPTAVGTTHALDIGFQLLLTPAPFVIAAAVRNLGFPLQVNNEAQADPLPTRVVVGVKLPLVRPGGQADALDLTLLADIEGSVGDGGLNPSPLVGFESGVRDVVRLRFGYAFLDAQARGPSLGLGLRVGRVGLDLARTFATTDPVSESEPVHISLRLAL